ncbi:VOC family protein [Streptomyces sp. 3213.3]|uniref:VOC family protein n=1 Tax=Streptomyces sp. 3213.3 TaxID=1855348 RepID=UPI003FA6C1CB
MLSCRSILWIKSASSSSVGPTRSCRRLPGPVSDLRTRDLTAEVRRVTDLGAAVLRAPGVRENGWTWHVLADPAASSSVLWPRPTPPPF